jgi:hypothetical protein
MRKNLPEGYPMPEFKDFWFTIVMGLVFTIIEKAFFKFFYPRYLPICKEKEN